MHLGRVINPMPNPQPGGPWNDSLSGLWHGWPYQECKTPADVALGVIGTCKLPYHNKVVTPLGADVFVVAMALTQH